MEFLSILYYVLFMPLQLFFEEVYFFSYQYTAHPGIAIIALSLIVNFLVLPLYNRADAMQEAERDMEKKLKKGVDHIKKTFKGDEQLMMLQTYYRQNNYSPTDVIRGSISLFLEIPFFVAAYQFLSHLDLLQGVSLGPIKDLGAADGLLTCFGSTINSLPLLMTLVNVISVYIFTKDFPLKTKLQLHGMAFFFLIFLYHSPAGLVFYWTLNNLFNLIKTIINKLDNPQKGVFVSLGIFSIVLLIYGLAFIADPSSRKRTFTFIFALMLNAPLLHHVWHMKMGKIKQERIENSSKPNKSLFTYICLFLTILIGGVIPAAVLVASPQEFVILGYFNNPLWYLVASMAIAFGTFIIWFGVFYWLADQDKKCTLERILWVFSVMALVDFMCFGRKLGLLNNMLQYENDLFYTTFEKNLSAGIAIVLIVVLCLLWKKIANRLEEVFKLVSVALMFMLVFNVYSIYKSLDGIQVGHNGKTGEEISFFLSKRGKNVIVFMLDRAMGLHVPFIMHEKPELQKAFSGFTYYKNTLSFAGSTNMAAPALFGGYEYTPLEINSRADEKLVKKHNEALKVLPVLFDKEGFKVTVCDLPYANYQWIPDLSIFDEYANVNKFLTIGRFGNSLDTDEDNEDRSIVEMNKRNFFCYSMVKVLPAFIQKYFYDDGLYNHIKKDNIGNQRVLTENKAENLNKIFMKSYNVLKKLPVITKVKEDGNSFLMIVNETTHAPALLQEPEYVPAMKVDNTDYEAKNAHRFNVDGKVLVMKNKPQYMQYQITMSAFANLGKWLEYLKENGVYDNTRIILVSDHGSGVGQFNPLVLRERKVVDELGSYFPLLLVKDFGSKEFTTSEEFMTNADVPSLAVKDVIKQPVNPFTGKSILNPAWKKKPQYVLSSNAWSIDKINGNTFAPGNWYAVEKDIWNENNWKVVKKEALLPY